MDGQKEINLLVAIIAANPNIIVHYSEIKEVVNEVWRESGTIIGAKPEKDDYPSKQLNWNGQPYINQRINRRKFSLRIISHG